MASRSTPDAPAAPPAAGPAHRLTAETLYREEWRYVLRLLPSYGVWDREAARDVAQTVWLTVVGRVASYDVATHKTPRAWLTGVVKRCAASHRREQRQRAVVVLDEEAGRRLPAPGLDPEEAALLRTLTRAIRDEHRREAIVLQLRHGLSVEEIAAVQEVSEDVIERRLHMARKELKSEGEEKKRGAFLGFGSLEALAEALRPKTPIPDEEGERLWERISERLRQPEPGRASDEDRSPPEPSPSLPAPAPVPALPSARPPNGWPALTKGMLAVLLAGAFAGGAGTGAGSVLAWQAYGARRDAREQGIELPSRAPGIAAEPSISAVMTGPGAAPASSSSSSATGVASRPALIRTATAAQASGARSLRGDVAASHRLVLRMRSAATAGDFPLVLALVEQHARRFPEEHVSEREASRIDALRALGRGGEAEQHARSTSAEHPEHRGAMERAMERAQP
jgi:RNA polymerase sigma factor (sigma-70 family)